MAQRFDCIVINKNNSAFMRVVGQFLDGLKILDKERFLEQYTTTIGRTIYVPFVIGEESVEFPLLNQVSILTHECVHVCQYRDEDMTFVLAYLFDSMARAAYEAQAMAANMEIRMWNDSTIDDIDCAKSAEKLRDYNCNDEEIQIVVPMLKTKKSIVSQGGLITEPGKVAISYLNAHI